MTVHRIDDRDLRRACGRVFCADADRLLREIHVARLDRETDELQATIDAKIEALDAPARPLETVERHREIDRLFKRMDRLMRERFGYDPKPTTEGERG